MGGRLCTSDEQATGQDMEEDPRTSPDAPWLNLCNGRTTPYTDAEQNILADDFIAIMADTLVWRDLIAPEAPAARNLHSGWTLTVSARCGARPREGTTTRVLPKRCRCLLPLQINRRTPKRQYHCINFQRLVVFSTRFPGSASRRCAFGECNHALQFTAFGLRQS
jgi:hypothetical protein